MELDNTQRRLKRKNCSVLYLEGNEDHKACVHQYRDVKHQVDEGNNEDSHTGPTLGSIE